MKVINGGGGQAQGWHGRGAVGLVSLFQGRSPHGRDSGARAGGVEASSLALLGLCRHLVGTGCRHFRCLGWFGKDLGRDALF